MNKRIKLLADQCREQEVVVEDGEEWIHAHFNEAKFAELIVEECANIFYIDEKNELGYIAERIRKHFGVK